jgi:two-component system, LuxR family, response regulator FixJ
VVYEPGPVAIVDDDAGVLDSLKFLLEVAGHRVATYRSAADFLAEGVRPCCLIVDQHMPQMTGLELIAELNRQTGRHHILLITGSSSQAILDRAAALGVTKVVDKPPGDNVLLDFVNACVGAQPRAGM